MLTGPRFGRPRKDAVADKKAEYIDNADRVGVERSFSLLKQENIYVTANFIVGFPSETWEEIRQTIKFAEDLNADCIKLFNAVPLSDTRLYQMAKEQNALVEGFDAQNVNWRNGTIETDEFTVRDMSILWAYEWDRINFSSYEKRKR